jgi:hypothetical protein
LRRADRRPRLEKDGRMFCCDHCAEKAGVTELRDRA